MRLRFIPKNAFIRILRLFTMALLMGACANDDDSGADSNSNCLSGPSLEATGAASIGQFGATLVGIAAEPTCESIDIVARGFVYGPNDPPMLEDDTSVEIDEDHMAETIVGLQPSTRYFYRVFLSTENETLYSNSMAFETLESPFTYIPDDNFEQALIALGLDDGLDDYVLTDNVAGVTELDLPRLSITSLEGIQAFTALEYLNCQRNDLTELDLTGNTQLKTLFCYFNDITELNVSQCPLLETIDCSYNGDGFRELDISQNPLLRRLDCNENRIVRLDVTQNPELETLIVSDNALSELDVTQNPKLRYLQVGFNLLTEIDLTQNPLLEVFSGSDLSYTGGNQFVTMDVTQNPLLRHLYFKGSVSSLDLSNNPLLEGLTCKNNNITTLDLSANGQLRSVNCNNNNLVSLNIANGNNEQIWSFEAWGNPDLFCIQVDPFTVVNENWEKDSHAIFSSDCN